MFGKIAKSRFPITTVLNASVNLERSSWIIVNRGYCKKLIAILPRQKHPYHYHKQKRLQLLSGDLEVEVDGQQIALRPGDTILVEPGCWHKFQSQNGAIFEEISTTHYNNDSYYEDQRIARLPREVRKTELQNWEAAIPNY